MNRRGLRRTRTGVVVSDKMDRTVVVEVQRTVRHQLYKKYLRKRVRFMVHDAQDECRIGDKVRIVESRPLSKHKRWRVQEKVT